MSDPDRRHAAHSQADHGQADHGHDDHGDHDGAHAGHHGEPEEETLAADEQPTPLWLSALGAGLFLVAFILIAAF